MSGCSWMITPSWLSGSWQSFLSSFSVYSCHLFLVSSASVRSIHSIFVLYCAHFCMICSLGISYFLKGISDLSHSIVFLFFFALISEEGFLISPCYSLELCIQMVISCIFSFSFCSQLFVRTPQTTILPFCISFPLGWSWSLPSIQCHKYLFIVLQALYQI